MSETSSLSTNHETAASYQELRAERDRLPGGVD